MGPFPRRRGGGGVLRGIHGHSNTVAVRGGMIALFNMATRYFHVIRISTSNGVK